MFGIPEFIASIGFKAIAGKALGGAASGIRSAGKWIGGFDAIHLLALALALVAGWQFIAIHGLEFRLIPFIGPRVHIVSLKGQIADAKADAASVRVALAASRANEAKLRTAIADQNKAVAALGQQSSQQQQLAAKAEKAASGRADAAEAVAQRLEASSRVPPAKAPPAGQCEPSDTLKGQWQ
jgi:hypothetical protein